MCQDCSSCCLTPFSEHTDSSLYTSGFTYSSMILVACILIPIWEIRKQNLTKKSDLRKALAPDLPYNGCKPMVWFQNVFRFSRGGKLCSHNIVCLGAQPCPTICDPMDCSLPGSSVHEDSPSMNTGMGCHALLQGIFPTQGLNPGLPHCRRILYCLSLQGRNSSYLSQEEMLYEEEESEGFYLKIAGSLGSLFFLF